MNKGVNDRLDCHSFFIMIQLVNTKVDVRFHVTSADWLPDWVKERLLQLVPIQKNWHSRYVGTASGKK